MSLVTLVIDMQCDFFAHERLAKNRETLSANINRVLGAARTAGAPIIWVKTEHAPDLHDASLEIRSKRINIVVSGTDGARILPELDHRPTDMVMVKKRYSAFYGTSLDALLRAAQCSRLVVCGINTHACVRSTVVDAYQRDIGVIIAEGCIDSHDAEHHDISWRYLNGKLATGMPVDQLVSLFAAQGSVTQPVPTGISSHRLSLERIAQARRVIDPVFLDTPQFESAALGAKLGCRVVVKVETLNPIGSFKARGAHFLTAQLPGNPHLVCATAGNFGQGMAHAARKRGVPITIFTNTGANPAKIARMRALGAEVRTFGTDPDESHQAARAFAAEHGAVVVEDGREAAISEGAGTIGIELLRWPEPFDSVLIPVGDGALLAGVARWIKAHSPATRMVGVCASGAPAMERSWRRGSVVSTTPPHTIADGLSIRTPFAESLTDLTGLVDDILLVEDDAMLEAMHLAQNELGVLLEPSGAAGIAALLSHGAQFRGQLVGTVLTGGNVGRGAA